ncbi:MAG: FHA domain-containing protein, partial [Myxococcota bacterium]
MIRSEDQLLLVVRAPNGDVREIEIGASALVIGRDESADIRVDDRKVSRRHAAFKMIDGEPWVEDLGSSNGVRLNEQKIDKRAKVGPNDEIRVGGFRMSLKRIRASDAQRPSTRAFGTASVEQMQPDSMLLGRTASNPARPDLIEDPGGLRSGLVDEPLPKLIGLDPPARDREYLLQRGENIIGRLEECDVPILDGSVSRQHARVVYASHRVTITDLESSNGIFVNDLRVDMAELAEGDVVRIGNVSFTVRLPPGLALSEAAPLSTRARARHIQRDRRWLSMGVAGLVLALLVLLVAFALQIRRDRPRDLFAFLTDDPGASLTASTADELDEYAEPGLVEQAPAAVAEPEPGLVAPEPAANVEPEVAEAAGPKAESDTSVEPGAAVKPGAAESDTSAGPGAAVEPGEPDTAEPGVVVEPGASAASEAPFVADADIPAAMTATSPFTRRGPAGLPLFLPEVDTSFDFEGFIAQSISEAKACGDAGDLACARDRLSALLERDPINPEAIEYLAEIKTNEAIAAAMAEADRRVARG